MADEREWSAGYAARTTGEPVAAAPPDVPPTAPPEFVSLFRQSMPPSYAVAYDAAAIGEHASIVWRRAGKLAHVESWRRVADGQSMLCVVTDDRPGLLSLITAAISAHGFETLDASIYCRAREGSPKEAVDFFLIRRMGTDRPVDGLGARDIANIHGLLVALLRSEIDVRSALRRVASSQRLRAPAQAQVAFDPSGEKLLVEADDRPGLLLTISSVLAEMRARIVESEVTTAKGRARDHFRLAEPDDAPLSDSRRKQIAFAVLLGIERLAGHGAT